MSEVIFHGIRQTFRSGNSRVITLPPGEHVRYQVIEGEGGIYVLIPEAHHGDIIEVA